MTAGAGEEPRVDPAVAYRWFTSAGTVAGCDAFDAHVLASILSLALVEAVEGPQPIGAGVGLDSTDLLGLVTKMFPHARTLLAELEIYTPTAPSADEACLRELLQRHTTAGTWLEMRLAEMIARRAQRPHHLWQDLGLRSRSELSWLMARHFEPLATRNRRDMKWKKFLYRAICRDQSFTICTAPSCAECCDFDHCFGDESGESLMAVTRRTAESGQP